MLGDGALTDHTVRVTSADSEILVSAQEALPTGVGSETKFIPDMYKFASVKSRTALLQGLLDTDGCVRASDNNIEYTTVSPRLAQDVAFVVQSLGGTARIRTKAASYLLWRDDFSVIRDYLLGNMDFMVSDSTGAPPRFAEKAGFVQDTYGVFAGSFLGELS